MNCLFIINALILLSATAFGWNRQPKLRLSPHKHFTSMVSERTERIFTSTAASEPQTFGAGGTSSLDGLIGIDKAWSALKNGSWKNTPKNVVVDQSEIEFTSDGGKNERFDVCVCGGTLGVFYAVALQSMGFKVSL